MNVKTFFVYFLMSVMAFLIGIAGGYYYMMKNEPQTITAEEEKNVSILEASTVETAPVIVENPPLETSEKGFLLTLDEGGIKVYKLLTDGKTEFLYKKEADINQLRQEDYSALCKGITVKSENEARSLLEDFLS